MLEQPPPRLFSHQEVLRALIRDNDIHEGRWGLIFELVHSASNINVLKEGESQPNLVPASLVMIQRVGLIQTNDVTDLTAEASEVNPPTKSPKSTKRPRTKGAK